MTAPSIQRSSAPLKTYSRRVNTTTDPQTTKKRLIEDISIVEEPSLPPSLPKKFKRDSIQNYFKPLPTPEPSSDSLDPAPSSSPPSHTLRSPTAQPRSLQRPRRRLNARPNLAPINKMSDSGNELLFDFDGAERETTPYLNRSSASASTTSLNSQLTLVNPDYINHDPVNAMATAGSFSYSVHGDTPNMNEIGGNSRSANNPIPSIINPTSSAIDIANKVMKKARSDHFQTYIDLGQTVTVQCKDCHMTYISNNAKDVQAHNQFHAEFVGERKVPKKKTGTDIWELRNHKVQAFDRTTPTALRDEAEAFYRGSFKYFAGLPLDSKELWSEKEVNVAELGEDAKGGIVPRYKLFIYYIDEEPVAFLLVESASCASAIWEGQGAFTPTFARVRMSIDRIWVKEERQRGGIATKLVSLARYHFINGRSLSKKDIAFSWPTSVGAEFGKRYVDGVVEGGWFLIVY